MVGYRVLIVDDDADAAALLREYLELSGYDVRQAGDGESGLKLLESEGADLVLLDIQMPLKDGFQTLAEIRRHPLLSEVPVLMLSHFDRPNLKVKGLEMGADDYIAKPFDRAELLARIKASLRRSARFRWITSSLDGDLGDVPLALLMQTLAMGDKFARIKLEDPPAEVLVAKGCFGGARVASHTGEEALLRLMFAARGKFSIAFEKPDPSPPGPRVDEVLLRLASRMDETNGLLTGGPGLEEWAVIEAGMLKFPRISGGAPAGALPLRNILIEHPSPLEAAVRAVVEAWRRSMPGGTSVEAA